MDCFVCDKPRAHQSPVCWIHRGIATKRWGYGAQPVELRVAGRCTIVNGCWLYHRQDVRGYSLKVMIAGKTTCAHRAILLAVRPPTNPNLDAAHLCPNRHCCNPDHLEWQTRKQNVATRARRIQARNPTCPKCLTNPKAKNQGWCQPCFNQYYRERRKNTERAARGA